MKPQQQQAKTQFAYTPSAAERQWRFNINSQFGVAIKSPDYRNQETL